MERLSIILNPRAGRGAEREADALRTAFAAAATDIEVIPATGAELDETVRRIVSTRPAFLGVAGGDGTLSTAATRLAHTETTLLPIPLGTMNHFAKRHGITTVDAAVHAWQQKHVNAISIGYVNNIAFINNASCGFYPHLVRHRDRLEPWLPRVLANWVAGIRVLARLPVMSLQLDTGEETHWVETPALWVGLGRGSLRLPQPGDAAQGGDVLEIVAPLTQRRREIVSLMTRTLFKLRRGAETPEDRALGVLHARAFTLDAPHRIDVGIDGEPHRLAPPLRFRYSKQSLRLLCLVGPA